MVRVGGTRRAAAKRCAYHTEQKSLERTFESIDPATIAEVLASHSGDMDRAAMDLVELERAGFLGASNGSSLDDKKTSGGGSGEDAEKTAAQDGSFWNDVLGDVTMDDDDEGDAAGASEGTVAFAATTDGVTPYASWPADQWSAVEVNVLGTLTEDVNLAEKLVGWRLSPALAAAETDAATADDDSIEILVKWKARALTHCSWVALPTLAAALNLAAQRLAKFWEKHPRAAGEAVAVRRECL